MGGTTGGGGVTLGCTDVEDSTITAVRREEGEGVTAGGAGEEGEGVTAGGVGEEEGEGVTAGGAGEEEGEGLGSTGAGVVEGMGEGEERELLETTGVLLGSTSKLVIGIRGSSSEMLGVGVRSEVITEVMLGVALLSVGMITEKEDVRKGPEVERGNSRDEEGEGSRDVVLGNSTV